MKRKSQRENSKGKMLAIAVIINFLCFFAVSALASVLIMSLKSPASFIGIGTLLSLLSAAVISSLVIKRTLPEGGLIISVLSALAFCLVLLTVGLIKSGGEAEPVCLFNYLCYMAIYALSAFIKPVSWQKKRRR